MGSILPLKTQLSSKDKAPIAQLVEQRPLKPWVPGSSPGGGTDLMQNAKVKSLKV